MQQTVVVSFYRSLENCNYTYIFSLKLLKIQNMYLFWRLTSLKASSIQAVSVSLYRIVKENVTNQNYNTCTNEGGQSFKWWLLTISICLQSLKNNIYHALPNLSNVQRPTLQAVCLSVPEPLEPRDFQARELFPWRSFLGR